MDVLLPKSHRVLVVQGEGREATQKMITEYFTPEFNDVLRRMLDREPSTRITMKELINHPWWKARNPIAGTQSATPAGTLQYDWDKINRKEVRKV